MKYIWLIYLEPNAMNESEREHCHVESAAAGRAMKNNCRWSVDLGTYRSTDQMEAHA